MKKTAIFLTLIVTFLVIGFIAYISYLKNVEHKVPPQSEKHSETQTERTAKEQILAISQKVLQAIRNKDIKTISLYIHPKEGVSFSPYVHASKNTNINFKSAELITAYNNSLKIYNWGVYDGSGQDILLSTKDYFNKFVYDKEYINTKEIAFNRITDRGNIRNNLKEEYPESRVVEYHIPNTSEETMDWGGIWLVFEKAEGKWYLRAIAHDVWTI